MDGFINRVLSELIPDPFREGKRPLCLPREELGLPLVVRGWPWKSLQSDCMQQTNLLAIPDLVPITHTIPPRGGSPPGLLLLGTRKHTLVLGRLKKIYH